MSDVTFNWEGMFEKVGDEGNIEVERVSLTMIDISVIVTWMGDITRSIKKSRKGHGYCLLEERQWMSE